MDSQRGQSLQSDSLSDIRERPTVTIAKACELVGVSRRSIYNWLASGKVEFIRTAGGNVRIFEDTLWRRGDGSPLRNGA